MGKDYFYPHPYPDESYRPMLPGQPVRVVKLRFPPADFPVAPEEIAIRRIDARGLLLGPLNREGTMWEVWHDDGGIGAYEHHESFTEIVPVPFAPP